MRRRLTQTATPAAVLCLLLAACGGGDTAEAGGSELGGTVTFANYGGSGAAAETDAWLDPFSEETGVTVVQDDPVTWSKVEQMVDAGAVTWDVVQGGITQGVVDNPKLEAIDCTIVDCAAFADADFPAYPQAIPLFTFSTLIVYNTEVFGANPPSGYDTFFDPAVPGTRNIRSIDNGWAGFLEAALMVDGVPRDQLYPLDVDRALSVFEPIRDRLVVMADDGQCITDVASGEAVMGTCYNGRALLAQKEGQPVGIAWGRQVLSCDYLYIPKGTPNLRNAQELIAYIVDNQGAIASEIAYGPANPKATIDPASEWLAGVPTENALDGDQAPIIYDQDWWRENREQVVEKIGAWLNA